MVEIRFSKEAREVIEFLKKESITSKNERMILKGVSNKIEFLKRNAYYGDQIKKKLIPLYYQKKYGADNLFRIELPQFWRMLYTLTDEEGKIEIIAFVLDVFDHKCYDKRFGYKNK